MLDCGYVSTKKDGGERLNFTAFYEALFEAKGINLSVGGSGSSRSRLMPVGASEEEED